MNKIYKLDAHNIDTTLPRFTNSLLKIFEFKYYKQKITLAFCYVGKEIMPWTKVEI